MLFVISPIFSGIVWVTKLKLSVKKPPILDTISVKKDVTLFETSVNFSGTVTVKKLPMSVNKPLIGVTILSLKKFVIDVFISSNFCGIVSVKNLPMFVNNSLIFSGNCLKNNLISACSLDIFTSTLSLLFKCSTI